MAKLKKISDSDFDLNKSVIIAGKGPTISNVEKFLSGKDLNDFYICGVNTAYQLLPKVDFLSFCDTNVLDILNKNRKDFNKIKSLVCPLVLRKMYDNGMCFDTDKTYEWLLEELKDLDINIYNFKLFTQHLFLEIDSGKMDDFYFKSCGEKAKSIPPEDTLTSSYHCGLLWLTKAGFKDFHIFGVSQQNEYHASFSESNDCGNDRDSKWYAENSLKGESILEENHCKYQYH
jgi:hypothetical protein